MLLIEQDRVSKDDTLAAPAKAVETTDTLYRLELSVPARKSATLHVVLRDSRTDTEQIESMKVEYLDKRINDSTVVLPPKVRGALVDLMTRLLLLAREKGDIEGKRTQRQAIGADHVVEAVAAACARNPDDPVVALLHQVFAGAPRPLRDDLTLVWLRRQPHGR